MVTATRLGRGLGPGPYRYVRLVFALVLAFMVFDEHPDALTMLGAGVIVASGCYDVARGRSWPISTTANPPWPIV